MLERGCFGHSSQRTGRNLRKQLIIQQETEGSVFIVNVARVSMSWVLCKADSDI